MPATCNLQPRLLRSTALLYDGRRGPADRESSPSSAKVNGNEAFNGDPAMQDTVQENQAETAIDRTKTALFSRTQITT